MKLRQHTINWRIDRKYEISILNKVCFTFIYHQNMPHGVNIDQSISFLTHNKFVEPFNILSGNVTGQWSFIQVTTSLVSPCHSLDHVDAYTHQHHIVIRPSNWVLPNLQAATSIDHCRYLCLCLRTNWFVLPAFLSFQRVIIFSHSRGWLFK